MEGYQAFPGGTEGRFFRPARTEIQKNAILSSGPKAHQKRNNRATWARAGADQRDPKPQA